MIERYAFITNKNHREYVEVRWPDAIKVGGDYRMIQFTDTEEPDLMDYIKSLGLTPKNLTDLEVISSMSLGALGPYVADRASAGFIVDYFNPTVESQE